MSLRARPSTTTNAPIEFKHDFAKSVAAAAPPPTQDETVRNILSRLDSLQSKVIGNEELKSTDPSKPTDLHARVTQLESIHRDHLERLGAQFNSVEDQLQRNNTDNAVIEQISSKFNKIESHIRSQSQLHDRIRSLESEVSSLRRAAEPHPDQERMLNKINARLDDWEQARSLGSRVDSSADTDRAKFLAARIDKLKELRSKYAN